MDYPSLPKWPALFVEGDDVTELQAQEILIRTSDFWIGTNARKFEQDFYALMGIGGGPNGTPDHERYQRATEEYQVLPLEFMANQRIASCYIGGPHGWCSWTGKIGTLGEYNIGKWPSCEKVEKELCLIAAAWPFLRMRVQLWNVEFGEAFLSEDAKPVVEFHVQNGEVSMKLEDIVPLRHAEHPDDLIKRQVGSMVIPAEFRETGISIERLKGVLDNVRHRLGLAPINYRARGLMFDEGGSDA